MNFVKKNIKLVVGIIIGAILISGISVYATSTYLASQVEYNKNGQAKVSDALDDLYNKSDTTITNLNNQISTLTTQLANISGGVSGEVNLSTTYEDVSLGFKPSKVILVSQNTKGNYVVVFIKDSSNDIDLVVWSNILPANNYTKNVNLGIDKGNYLLVITDNGFKVEAGNDETSGKYYYYAIK